ncbi:hypothetical protein J6590_006097 [Homalodisca vitripennis]|nr:hypothetical protein J6590_006097 [Homalodisca vitripennis]
MFRENQHLHALLRNDPAACRHFQCFQEQNALLKSDSGTRTSGVRRALIETEADWFDEWFIDTAAADETPGKEEVPHPALEEHQNSSGEGCTTIRRRGALRTPAQHHMSHRGLRPHL